MEKRLPRIVLTGAPGAGKTTTVNALRNEIGNLVLCAPEVATPLMFHLDIKSERTGEDFSTHPEFQKAIYEIQKSLENLSDKFARYSGKKAILLDKARVEMAAHVLLDKISVNEGKELYKKMFNTAVTDVYKDYDLVLFLELPKKEIYDQIRGNNPVRYHQYEESRTVGERVREVWKDHPNFKIISSYETWEEKLNKVRETIIDFLKNNPL